MSVRVRPEDLVVCGLCARGAARWIRLHGLDWREFIDQGIPEERLSQIDDARLKDLIATARRREGK